LLRIIAASNDEFSGEFWIVRLTSTIGSFLQKRPLAEAVPNDWVGSIMMGRAWDEAVIRIRDR